MKGVLFQTRRTVVNDVFVSDMECSLMQTVFFRHGTQCDAECVSDTKHD